MRNRLLEEITAALPVGFVEDLIAAQPEIYQQSYEATYNGPLTLADAHAEFLWPYYRRAYFETRAMEIGGKYGLRCGIEQNASRNHKYTIIKAGRFLLTSSHVTQHLSDLQPATFRKQHASLNSLLPQLLMQEIIPDAIAAPGDLYAIIVHCAGWKDSEGEHPGFLKLGIPSQNNTHWEQEFEFAEILGAYPQATPSVEDQATVAPKWKKQDKSQES